MVSAWSEHDANLELGLRVATVQVGWWLGWASVVVVFTGIALDVGVQHRGALVALTLAAAIANGAAMTLPLEEVARPAPRAAPSGFVVGRTARLRRAARAHRQFELLAAALPRRTVHRRCADR